jgi:hypothetical protein
MVKRVVSTRPIILYGLNRLYRATHEIVVSCWGLVGPTPLTIRVVFRFTLNGSRVVTGCKHVDSPTRFASWSGKPVDYSMLRIFDCSTYVHVQSGERSKLDSKSRKCICLGLESSVKGYRLWDPISKEKIVSRDVMFDEAYILRMGEGEASIKSQKGKQVVEVELDEQSSLTDICDDKE